MNGSISVNWLKEPANPKWAKDPAMKEYKALMAKFMPSSDANNQLYYYGFAKGETFVQAMYKAGKNPTRASFRQALESLRGLDLGIGAPLTFGPERHQGLDNVYFTRVNSERGVPVADWSAAVRA